VLNIFIIILTVFEIKTGKIYDYNVLHGEDAFGVPPD